MQVIDLVEYNPEGSGDDELTAVDDEELDDL
jgi:hypothetical protein